MGFDAAFGPGRVVDPGPVTGREDVGMLATAAGVPLVFWLLGRADQALFAEPTLALGVSDLVTATPTWLPRAG